MKYGTVGRALQDLTGSVVQSVPPSGPLLGGSVPRSTILVAISGSVSWTLIKILFDPFLTPPSIQEKDTKRRRSGLLPEHPYCVTGLARVRTNSSTASQSSGGSTDTNLIRLRSPWAGGEYGGVWGGPWSERSWEWNALSERDRELLASRTQHEGEFW